MKHLPKTRSEAINLNSTHYFTGKPCKNGHVDKRRTAKGVCLSCSKDFAKKKRGENPELMRERCRKWAESNRDKSRESSKNWRDNNKDKYKQSQRQWEEKNGEKRRLMASHRRAMIAKAGGTYSIEQIHEMLGVQGYVCADSHCGKSLDDGYHIDHIIPLCKGGSNYISNIQCLCQGCNTSKGGKMPSEWEEYKAKVMYASK